MFWSLDEVMHARCWEQCLLLSEPSRHSDSCRSRMSLTSLYHYLPGSIWNLTWSLDPWFPFLKAFSLLAGSGGIPALGGGEGTEKLHCIFKSRKWSSATVINTCTWWSSRSPARTHRIPARGSEVFGFNRRSQLQSLVYAEITGQSCKVKFNLLFYWNCACCVI